MTLWLAVLDDVHEESKLGVVRGLAGELSGGDALDAGVNLVLDHARI